jgi:bifunctional non-homologous end joining protein LigD
MPPYKPQTKQQYSQIRPKTIPQQYRTPVKPMLAQEGKHEDLERPNYESQRKFDGTRIIIIKDGDRVVIRGARNWINDYAPKFPEVVEEVRRLPVERCILDGEMTFFKKGTDRDVFVTALANPETKKNYEAKAMVFDVLYVDDDSLEHLPFDDRDDILKTLIPGKLRHVEVVKTVSKDKEKFFEGLKAKQGEGVVLKEAESPYRQGVRSPEWLKLKHWKSDEAIVVGYTQGKGARASTFGALILAQKDPKTGKLRYIGKTSGLKEAETRSILKKMNGLKVQKSSLAEVPPDANAKAWVQPKIVVEIKYYERTPYGLLRFPDFLRERMDKKPSECTFKAE